MEDELFTFLISCLILFLGGMLLVNTILMITYYICELKDGGDKK